MQIFTVWLFFSKAEEITLTIGQAFDLAYRKFLESGGKDVETRKQIAGMQKRVSSLSFLLHICLACVQGNLCMVEQTEKACHELSITRRALLSAYSYNSSYRGLCTVFNCFILNSRKNLVFSCDFASLPDASHGDQSSRGSRCWVSGFPCSSDSFVI